jgi:acyl carrier protein
MFSELGRPETSSEHDDAGPSLREALSAVPETDRLDVVATHVRHIVAAVFDCAVTDIDSDDVLDDLGLDSMMAMDFRVRINAAFSVDLPVLEILRGVSVNSLAVRVLADIPLPRDDGPAVVEPPEDSAATDEDVDRLIEQLSESDLRLLLAELEGRPSEPEAGGAQT